VVYAGMESKLQKNANKPRSKFSQIEMQLNKFIAWLFIINILLCAGLTAASVVEFPKARDPGSIRDARMPTLSLSLFPQPGMRTTIIALFALILSTP
jgi:magnesium-transporting ATPase (P-type)